METSKVVECTIQIPIADRDAAFAEFVLPHQMSVIGKYASDVLISVNRQTQPTDPGPLDTILAKVAEEYENVRVLEVDYSPEAVEWVAGHFFSGKDYPLFDFKGIPIHAFLEQYRHAKHDFFMHLASDMFLGGSGPWLDEAIECLSSDDRILLVSPHAGPISSNAYHSSGVPTDVGSGASYEVPSFRGRTHLVDLRQFIPAMKDLPMLRPPRIQDRIQAKIAGTEMIDHLELLFDHNMRAQNFTRIDMGGTGGLWTLHPVHKTPDFVAAVPGLIADIEADRIPDAQYGHYDVHSSMVPQSDIPGRRDLLVRSLRAAMQRPWRALR